MKRELNEINENSATVMKKKKNRSKLHELS